MPTFRKALDEIQTYDPGKPIDEVSRDLGITDIIKLASNESPLPPFPEVQRVIAGHAAGVNRYPENSGYHLVRALADIHGLPPENIWLGGGSTNLLMCVGLAVGESGTSAVFPWPSFIMYPIIAALSGANAIRVPVDGDFRVDAAAMKAAIRPDTTVAFLCNPNNPTATHISKAEVDDFIDSMPDRVMVVIDEAYHDFADAPDYASAIPRAIDRPNVVVSRTFSKVYGLAGLRVGYMVGMADTLRQLRKAQVPFSINSLAQAAAREALAHPARVRQRVADNASGRRVLLDGFTARGVAHADSQANFVFVVPDGNPHDIAAALLRLGVIVRPMGERFIRVTVGTAEEVARFLRAWDEVAVPVN